MLSIFPDFIITKKKKTKKKKKNNNIGLKNFMKLTDIWVMLTYLTFPEND